MTPPSAPSRSAVWDQVRDSETLLAQVARARDHTRVIRLQAWNEASWDTVYDEATRQEAILDDLREQISAVWYQLHAAAQEAS